VENSPKERKDEIDLDVQKIDLPASWNPTKTGIVVATNLVLHVL